MQPLIFFLCIFLFLPYFNPIGFKLICIGLSKSYVGVVTKGFQKCLLCGIIKLEGGHSIMAKAKTMGQVFTPSKIVHMMLDRMEYVGSDILGKYILEPSFGDGAFLVEMVQRYLSVSAQNGIPKEQVLQDLDRCFYGVELDPVYYTQTKDRLNALLCSYGYSSIPWSHLYQEDFLSVNLPKDFFDFVIGNPPYVRIHHLTEIQRTQLKSYSFTKGTTDLYVAFFEKGISLMSSYGTLLFITPNAWMKNVSQKPMREYLLKHNLLAFICDFQSFPVFDVHTYVAITCLKKQQTDTSFTYECWNETKQYETTIDSTTLNSDPWMFGTKADMEFLNFIQNQPKEQTDLKAQFGVVTNCDQVYIGLLEPMTNNLVKFHEEIIEKDLFKPAYKASTYKGDGSHTWILFPYMWNGSTYEVISESSLGKSYPHTYAYLCKHKEQLSQRNMEKGLPWYAFGRSQGIQETGKKKLIFSHIFSEDQESFVFYELPADSIVYSGIFLTGSDLLKWKPKLESKEFMRYCKLSGKDMHGGYKSIGSKQIKQYVGGKKK